MAVTKRLVSTLLRSLYSGRIAVFRNQEHPLFKIERKALSEFPVPFGIADRSETSRREITRQFLFGVDNFVTPERRQWVLITNPASLALRNPDHLFAPDSGGSYPPPEVDFYWARAGGDDIANSLATPGLWAVRGEHLPLVLERWKEAWNTQSGATTGDEEAIWTRVVQQLPLRKRVFEKGEVVAPRIGAVDWEAVSNAAFVTVPDWPEKEAWKFLQALYFGTYLGDETGMMLNILEA